MPLKDVKVTVKVSKAARLTGLGKPLILARFAGPSTFTNYAEPEEVAAVFGEGSIAHKLATALLKQGDSSPATLAVATYDPEAEDDTPKTAATALALHYDEDFFFITADTQVLAEVKAIADLVEGEALKMYGVTADTLATLTALSNQKYDYTFAMLHETADEYSTEALIGAVGSKPVGSLTWFNQQIAGITPQAFNAAKVEEIEALNGFAFVTKSGYNVTSEGTVLSGEYIDVIHSKSWLIVNGANAIQTQLILNDKVAYTDSGFAILASALENVFKAGVEQGMISVTDNIPDYTITTLSRAETSAADRAARKYRGLKAKFKLAGAIHEADVEIEMEI